MYQKMQPDLFSQPTGEQLRDEGIQRAVDNANRLDWSWSQRAFTALCLFARTATAKKEPFKIEDVRAFASWIPEPPSKRAWGAIAVRAAKAGIIVKAGHAPVNNPKAHKAFASLWRVAG